MIDESHEVAIKQMLEAGTLTRLDPSTVDAFVEAPHPHLLFFPGPKSVKREAHDVAVALRELLLDYTGVIDAGLIPDESAGNLPQHYRAKATPCLVLMSGPEILEVLPRVRDWSDYAAAFHRYLGPAPRTNTLGAQA